VLNVVRNFTLFMISLIKIHVVRQFSHRKRSKYVQAYACEKRH